MASTSCAIAGPVLFIFSHRPRNMPHARCSLRSGLRGRTSHAAQDPSHLSTMWPRGDICRRSSVGRSPDFVSRYVVGPNPTVCTIGVTSCLAAARSVSLRKWSFLCAVRKRQDEKIYVLAGTGFVKMNGCDRRTGAGLKSSVGYRHCCTLRECRGVQWMWRGGGNRMIRPLCKQFKQSAMPGPVKRITPNVGGVGAPRGG